MWRSRNSTAAVLPRPLSCQDVQVFNTLEVGVIPSRRASFHPITGRLRPKLGPGLILAFSGALGDGHGPPFKAVSSLIGRGVTF
jgi:hypothetical protein